MSVRFTPRRAAAAGDPTRTIVDISDEISDSELEERVDQLRGYDRLTQRQVDDLADYEQAFAIRQRVRNRARLERAIDPTTGRVRAGHGESVADQQARDQQQRTQRDAEPSGPRDAARRVIERAHSDGLIPADAAEKADRLVTDGPETGQGIAARWVTVTGDPAYRTAFATKLARGDDARDLWTDDERRAWQRVLALQAEMRAMGLGDTAGGFMVPLTLDPTILLTSAGSINPLRQISRVVQIATDNWNGINSAGATAEWKAEAAEAADGSPVIGQPSIPVHFGDAFVPYSFEVGMDAANFLGELQRVLVDAADQLMATAYTLGSGTGQPFGVITTLPAGSVVASGTADTFVKADVYNLQAQLPPRFQANARWCAALPIVNLMSQFETAAGARLFPEISEGRLLNRPLHELSNMDGVVDAAQSNKVLLYGDFQQFVIVDRIGTTLEILPHLVGANRRPTGQRGALLWFRTGSDVVVDNAFRVLDC